MGFYGRYASFGDTTVIDAGDSVAADTLSFALQHSYDDWLSNSWGTGMNMPAPTHTTVAYTPIDPTITAAASTVWQNLATAVQVYPASSSGPVMTVYKGRIQSAIDAIDGIEKSYPQVPNLWTNPDTSSGLRQSRINQYNILNQALTDLSNVTVPDPTTEKAANDALVAAMGQKVLNANAAATAKADLVSAQANNNAVAIAQALAATKAANAAAVAANADVAAKQQALVASSAADTAAPDSGFGNVPIIAALIGVPVVGFLAWHFLKKPSKPVAGYRRRSRRSRR